MTPGLVSVLILNWNGAQFLSRCLASVRAQTYRLLEIVVIDNGSIDGSADQMAGQADVRLIRNGRNLGFAMAYDQAIPSAAGEFILLRPEGILPMTLTALEFFGIGHREVVVLESNVH